ncbi:hypothetical protein [Puerhibacterium sp. TATVAM-FAB25]|uniref:hypothetical protein n=1 Tax=Puerhibacterium sp. TATVAM-FAB25 TaxID=3093699 RepID=UPI003979DF96
MTSAERFELDEVPLADVAQAPSTARADGGIPVGTDRAAGTTTEGAPELGVCYDCMCFAGQPAENTAGMTDDRLADVAAGAGVPQEVADGIADGTAVDTCGQRVASATQAAGRRRPGEPAGRVRHPDSDDRRPAPGRRLDRVDDASPVSSLRFLLVGVTI